MYDLNYSLLNLTVRQTSWTHTERYCANFIIFPYFFFNICNLLGQIWSLLHSAVYDINTQWDPRDDWSWINFNLFNYVLDWPLYYYCSCCYYSILWVFINWLHSPHVFNRLHQNLQHSGYVVIILSPCESDWALEKVAKRGCGVYHWRYSKFSLHCPVESALSGLPWAAGEQGDLQEPILYLDLLRR